KDAITSGLEGAWSGNPTAWTTQYLDNLFAFDWVTTQSPAGATQWIPADGQAADLVPDAADASQRYAPIMFTTDLALKFDPSYQEIAKRFQADPEAFQVAFAKAWYKLTHRDMGPGWRYRGDQVPAAELLWQDPIPAAEYPAITDPDVQALKTAIRDSAVSRADLVGTAWAAAASYRGTDKRGGPNGGRLRLAPQRDWPVNDPSILASVLSQLAAIQQTFNAANQPQQVSMADLIVLGGVVAVEDAADAAGCPVAVPFHPGRTDASQAQTDVTSFSVLEPTADAFRNYYDLDTDRSPVEAMVERASLLTLSVPEMTVLVGGMRVLGANSGKAEHGMFTDRLGVLSNDFFVNLLSMSTRWQKSAGQVGLYEGVDRATGQVKWTATPVDLIFGSHSELRAVAEVYAAQGGEQRFVDDFVSAWTRVMNLDRPPNMGEG
ncbi:MAG: catalase-peroxidase, partial [Halioglobus sp.]|nr:catalase-peroxidase [Halioglobus sp.]